MPLCRDSHGDTPTTAGILDIMTKFSQRLDLPPLPPLPPPVVSKRAANQPQNLADSLVSVGAAPNEASGPRDRTLEYCH
jgi:hypothetical protein